MRRFKILIISILFISINQHSLYIFADTISFNKSSYNTPVISIDDTQTIIPLNNENNNSTVLDGEIGEWDPENKDKLDFNNSLEIDGHKPTENDYYTISVTVPLNMEFYVLPNSNLALGSFFSPTYKIKNNGSKNISVKINSFEMQNTRQDNDTAQLYVEKLNSKDNKTQIELKMCAINTLDTLSEVTKEIDLTEVGQFNDSDKELYVLSKNETKGVKFYADRWELPQNEANKEKAISDFNAGFVFSVVRP